MLTFFHFYHWEEEEGARANTDLVASRFARGIVRLGPAQLVPKGFSGLNKKVRRESKL